MALKEIVDTSSAAQYKFEKLGQTLKGHIVASEEFLLNGKMVRKHVFNTSKGLQGVLGSTDLNKKLETLIAQFGLGIWIEATWASNLKTKQPLPMKVYNVKYDDENRVEVAGNAQLTQETQDEEVYAPTEEELAEVESAEIEEVAQKMAPPSRQTTQPAEVSKAAQSRVQSVLARRATVKA